MSGLFETFNIVKRGMSVQQTSLQVTGHNIANANTDGYSVQRANLRTTQPFGMPSLTSAAEPGQLGTGVEVASITRQRDEFLDGQVRREKGTLGKFEAKEQFLSEIETIFMEPSDTGLSKTLGNFWDSWSQLSNTSEPNSTARTLVAQNADTLAKSINHTYGQLKDLETNAGELMRQQVFEVNGILDQVTELNTQIKAVVIGGETPNDLMDRRDLLLDQLSERFGFDVDRTNFSGIEVKAKMLEENGNVTRKQVLTDGVVNQGVAYINKTYTDSDGKSKMEIYVDGDPNKSLEIDITGKESKYAGVHVVLYNKDSYESGTINNDFITAAKFDTGSLNGYESIKNNVETYKKQLNNLSKVLAVAVNTIHSNNGEGINFFDASAETSDEAASVLKVNSDILKDPKLINAGKLIGTSGSEGNGERALLINQIRNTKMDIEKISKASNADVRKTFIDDVGLSLDTSKGLTMTGDPNGMTLDNYFKSSITDLGVVNQDAKRNVTNQESLLSQLETRRDSISGVSIDEEVTNMIQFSKSYQANAKMISVIDELLDVVVNGLKK